MAEIQIQLDDPQRADVNALLEAHLAHANRFSADQDVHALDADALSGPDIQFFSARRGRELLGVGALKRLTENHHEIKSMHTAEAARRQGIARLMVEHLLQVARAENADRVSLETGTMEAMAPARTLYASLGFVECAPFAGYWETEASVCMTINLASQPK